MSTDLADKHGNLIRGLERCLEQIDRGTLPFKARLADRVRQLASAYADDYEGRFLSADALGWLLGFLESATSLGYPDLTATPAGDLYAEWRGPKGQRLTIEFLASGEALYLLFSPNPKHYGRMDRLSGMTTADALVLTIASLSHLSGLAA